MLVAAPLAAQREHDQARLFIGAGLLHVSGGGAVWQVGQQPLLDAAGTDTARLARNLTSALGITIHGAYFPSANYGFAAELVVTRMGTADDCTLTSRAGTDYAADLCGSLQNNEGGASTAIVAGGVMLRPDWRGGVQPYLRGMGGFAIMQESFVATDGQVRAGGGEYAAASVYHDENVTTTSPYLTVGLGLATPLGPGWQGRVEVRDSWLRLTGVDHATARQGVQPKVMTRGHHLLMFMVSIDVVLERKRGRRY